MRRQLQVIAVVGSLRRESFTRRVVNTLMEIAPEGLSIDIVPIGTLPFYNEDDDRGAPPPEWQAFRARVRACDAVLFATPEYNRSMPAVMKNAIDVGSRPYGDSVWAGKPAAVLSASPGAIGGFGANHHLRQCLAFLDMPVLQQPEAYLGRVDRILGADGKVEAAESIEFLRAFVNAFERWIRRVVPGAAEVAPAIARHG